MPAKTTETAPLTLADLEAKAEALIDRKDATIRDTNELRLRLGDELLAGDRRSSLTEKKIVNNDRELDRLDLEIQAIERAKAALRDAQARAERAALEAEYVKVRDRIHAANLAVAEGITALTPLGATLIEDGKRARQLARQLGYGDGRAAGLGPAQGYLETILRSVVPSLYSGRPDTHARTALDALRKPWRVPDGEAPDDDTHAAEAD